MIDKAKNMILSAFKQMLAALIRLALRNGVSFPEFAEMSKSLYVHIASTEYGINGRAANDSRVALITGLNRRDIKKVKNINDNDGDNQQHQMKTALMSKVLTAWHQDPKYQTAIDDHNTIPLELTLEGESPNFTELVKDYGGDMAAITVLRELKHSHVIEETKKGALKVLSRTYIPNYYADKEKVPQQVNPEDISFASSMLVDHINTIFFNLYRDKSKRNNIMELRAVNPKIKQNMVANFYNYADNLSLDYLTKVDNWLTEHQATENEPSERVGVGLYFIEGANESIRKENDHE